MSFPAASRALVLPGPQPPLSHLGATLVRHAVATGLRYALYQLGVARPEGGGEHRSEEILARPALRIHRLRVYLDAALAGALAGRPGGEEAAHALLDPGGAGRPGPGSAGLRGALLFHRVRLAVLPRRLPRAAAPPPEGGTSEDPWSAFRGELSRCLPAVSDALLAELVAALRRRAARAADHPLAPCLPACAWRLRVGRRTDLGRLGSPDLLAPSWAAEPERARAAALALAAAPLPPRDRLRGSFRETWRATLDRLRPPFLELAARAAERGLIAEPEDAFFLPLDVAPDLTAAGTPAWIRPALDRNRREWEELLAAPSPPDALFGDGQETLALRGAPVPERSWELAPLWPLA